MIEPGKITMELILNSPILYIGWIYLIPLIIGAAAAYFADRAADEHLKTEVKTVNPTITNEALNDVYEFEHIRDPIAWGILVVIVVVYPMASTLDTVGDWSTVWASAVLAGLVSRSALKTLAGRFRTKALSKP